MRRLLIIFVLLTTWVGLPGAASAEQPRPFDGGSFEAILKQHQGQPLVVSFWSLTCPPCIAEMPLWRDALADYPEVALVLVATDDVEQTGRIVSTLERFGLGDVDSWIFADPFVERLRYSIDSKWRGELPRTYFIDADGVRTAFSGKVKAKALKTWVIKARVIKARVRGAGS